MKLLIYSPMSIKYAGGVESFILDLGKRLKGKGIDVTVVTSNYVGNEKRLDKMPPCPFHIYELRHKFFGGLLFPSYGTFQLLRRLVADADITYFVNAFALHDLIFLYLKQITGGKPMINSIHAPLITNSALHNLYTRRIRYALFRFFDATHVLNSDDAMTVKSLGAKRVYVIPYGIDVNMFKPAEQNTRLEAFKILFVGRLTYQKGVDTLCKAIKLLSHTTYFRRMFFTIVGSGPMESFVKALTAKLSNVSFLGYLQRDLLPEIYRIHHVLVMPSRWETLGLTAVEAQACGLPVIGTKVPGLKDVIEDGRTGELIQPEDALSLANSILKFYRMYDENAEAFRRMANFSRERASKIYDWNIVIESFHKMLSDVLNEERHTCHLHSELKVGED